MLKKISVKLLAVVAAATALLLTSTTAAYADGTNITWSSRGTDRCLHWTQGLSGFGLRTLPSWDCPGVPYREGYGWLDSQSNLQDQTGQYWTERPYDRYGFGDSGQCLTAYWAPQQGATGQAYLEPCSSPANYYEQWQEVWVGNGFNLVNRETGWCLDGNDNGSVYTLPCQSGNQYQVWY